MKKLTALLTALLLIVCLSACGKQETAAEPVPFQDIRLDLPEEYRICYQVTEGGTLARTYTTGITETADGIHLELGDTGEDYVYEKLESGKYLEYHLNPLTGHYEAIALTDLVQAQIDAGLLSLDALALDRAVIDAYATRVTGYFAFYETVADTVVYQGLESINGTPCQKYSASYTDLAGRQRMELWIDAITGLCMKLTYSYDAPVGGGLFKTVECTALESGDLALPEYKT